MPRLTSTSRPRTLALAALALLALPLSGCSLLGLPTGGNVESGASGSSTEGAAGSAGGAASKCQVASAAIDRVTAEAAQSVPQLIADGIAGNPVDAGSLVDPVIEALDAASASITDPAVLTALGEAQSEWTGLASDIGALGAPDLTGLADGNLAAIGDLQAYGAELSGLFSERLPALQETGARLQQACEAQ